MAILFSGDFHGNEAGELSFLTKKVLIKKHGQIKYNRIKYHIILGDGGFMWHNKEKTEKFNYKTLANRSFPILCVLGNHEPIYGMNNLKEIDIGIGETVWQINTNPFTAYLKRGKVYHIDGIKFLVLGGALSIDKKSRKPGIEWWEQEYWTKQEEQDLFKLLETENTFDYVISHTGPHHINVRLFERQTFLSEKFSDEAALLNDDVHNKITFREWLCGHWHQEITHHDINTNLVYHYMYKSTKILEKTGNEFELF